MTIYIIDTSAIIELFRHYPSDLNVFKPIWTRIDELINSKELISHYEVYNEIIVGNDEVIDWCKCHREMFLDPDEDQIHVLNCKVKKLYDPYHWNKQMNRSHWADPWLISLAIVIRTRQKRMGLQEDVKIVTNESKKRENNIPRIAEKVGIVSLKILEFFRDLKL